MKIRNVGFAGDSGAQYFISQYREEIVRSVSHLIDCLQEKELELLTYTNVMI